MFYPSSFSVPKCPPGVALLGTCCQCCWTVSLFLWMMKAWWAGIVISPVPCSVPLHREPVRNMQSRCSPARLNFLSAVNPTFFFFFFFYTYLMTMQYLFPLFHINFPWSDGTRCQDLSFLNVEFLANFFTIFFHFHQDALWFFFTFSLIVVSSAYLRLLIFFPAILIQACASSSPAFLMMYSAYIFEFHNHCRWWLQPWN